MRWARRWGCPTTSCIVSRSRSGLAIRIIGTVTREKLEILKNADAIVREELDAYNVRVYEETGERNSERSVWQYFAVLPDVKSVGVMGDERTYAYPIICEPWSRATR